MKTRQRLVKDNITKSLVYALGSIGMVILTMIIVYVVSTGINLVRWETIIGDSRDRKSVV